MAYKNYLALALGLATTLSVATPTLAQVPPSGRGHITLVEAFDYPRFQLDVDFGECPAGTWLTMSPEVASAEKIKSGQSLVLAAYLSQREVRVYAAPGFDGCNVTFLHLL